MRDQFKEAAKEPLPDTVINEENEDSSSSIEMHITDELDQEQDHDQKQVGEQEQNNETNLKDITEQTTFENLKISNNKLIGTLFSNIPKVINSASKENKNKIINSNVLASVPFSFITPVKESSTCSFKTPVFTQDKFKSMKKRNTLPMNNLIIRKSKTCTKQLERLPKIKCSTSSAETLALQTNCTVNRKILAEKENINKQSWDNKNCLFSYSENIEKIPKDLFNGFQILTVKNVNYIVMRVIGKGGSSRVFDCYDPSIKEYRAIKQVNLDMDQAEDFINEVKMLQKLQKCDRIITMFD